MGLNLKSEVELINACSMQVLHQLDGMEIWIGSYLIHDLIQMLEDN